MLASHLDQGYLADDPGAAAPDPTLVDPLAATAVPAPIAPAAGPSTGSKALWIGLGAVAIFMALKHMKA